MLSGIKDFLRSEQSFSGHLHREQPDRPQMTAAQLKAFFDHTAVFEVSAGQVNGLIGFLQTSAAAADIGAVSVDGSNRDTDIQSVLISLQEQVAVLSGDTSGGIVTSVNGITGKVIISSADINNPDTENTVAAELNRISAETAALEEKYSDISALMALQGFTAQTTEFSSDGTVTQTNSLGHTLVTSFGSGCITQTFTADKTITKTITPGENNSITEEIS